MRVHTGILRCLILSLSFDCQKSESGLDLLDSIPGKYMKHQTTISHADLLILSAHNILNILIDNIYL